MHPAVVLESTEFLSSNSYAKVARNHALFLERHGFRVVLRSRQHPKSCSVPREVAEHLKSLHERPSAGLKIRYNAPSALCSEPNGICMTPFETATLRNSWVEAARQLRLLCVHCDTSRQQFLAAGVWPEKVETVHHGYDPLIYRPDVRPLRRDTRYTFLYVGHFNARKCVKMLIRQFCSTFRSSQPVKLLLCVQAMNNRVRVPEEVERIKVDFPDHAEVELFTQPFDHGIPEDQMGALYRSADCLVYPSMGEGFGLPALEAKACGLEVITTRCSGMLDFLDDRSAHFIDVKEIREDGRCDSIDSEYRDLKFWIPDEESLSQQMLAVFEGARRTEIPSGWTWDLRLKQLPRRLELLMGDADECASLEMREAELVGPPSLLPTRR